MILGFKMQSLSLHSNPINNSHQIGSSSNNKSIVTELSLSILLLLTISQTNLNYSQTSKTGLMMNDSTSLVLERLQLLAL